MRDTDRYGYGLRIRSLGPVAELPLADPAADHPLVRFRYDDSTHPPAPTGGPDEWRCVRSLADGRVLSLDRRAGAATLHGSPPTPDLLPHPYLTAAATVVNRWAGRESFHAGSFAADGRVWAVLGVRTAGKSSLLAALAADGIPVLSDDVLVTDGRYGYAGPRCLDLREPVPGSDLATVPVRYGTRLRVALPPVPDRLPVGGWCFLRWGDEPALRPVPATDLLGRLAARRAWPELPSDPAVLFSLATLPAWEVVRPRDWRAMPAVLRLLRDATGRAVPAGSTTGGR
ncbi:hypothetical protein [Micromonospora humi]|uniref:Hpr(Ser) kinase/phosphatase n=1 Tax=Micromonospora humi TaxID=745366 RepID=A0A1C5I7I9_9ACTN|nr:hypothetical protein [Micromonospora humi]SCG54145.1 hypothetical protein GA0070213_10532 [Micromonospora humi]